MQLKQYGEIMSTIALLPTDNHALVLQEVLGVCYMHLPYDCSEAYDQLDSLTKTRLS